MPEHDAGVPRRHVCGLGEPHGHGVSAGSAHRGAGGPSPRARPVPRDTRHVSPRPAQVPGAQGQAIADLQKSLAFKDQSVQDLQKSLEYKNKSLQDHHRRHEEKDKIIEAMSSEREAWVKYSRQLEEYYGHQQGS